MDRGFAAGGRRGDSDGRFGVLDAAICQGPYRLVRRPGGPGAAGFVRDARLRGALLRPDPDGRRGGADDLGRGLRAQPPRSYRADRDRGGRPGDRAGHRRPGHPQDRRPRRALRLGSRPVRSGTLDGDRRRSPRARSRRGCGRSAAGKETKTTMNAFSLFTSAGNKLLDALPPKAETQAWKAFQGTHLALFRASGRRLGTRFGGVKVLFLHHFGAKSGVERISPLLYIEDGGNLAIIASKGGHTRNPAWFHNLKAHPDVRVEMRGEVRNVRARVAAGDERERIWRKAAKVWPDYDNYQKRAPHREIPVVVLEPRG